MSYSENNVVGSMGEAIRRVLREEHHLLEANPCLQSLFSKLEDIAANSDAAMEGKSCKDTAEVEQEDCDSDGGFTPKRIRLRSRSTSSSELTDNEEPSDGNNSAAEAMSNDCILTTVFQYLMTTDLKECRLVNKKFCEIATFVLLQKRCCEMTIDYSKEETPIRLLSDLCDCIARSKKFPVSSLRLQGTPSFLWDFESNPKLMEFFNNYASSLTSVHLNFGSMKLQHWKIIFTELLPNIECLDLGFVFLPPPPKCRSVIQKEQSSAERLGNLPCLRSLCILEDFHLSQLESKKEDVSRYLFRQLSTPSLQSIRNVGCEFLPDILEVKRVSAVKELRFMPKNVNDIELLSKFAEENPQLECINIVNEYVLNNPSMKIHAWLLAKVLSKILISSKSTLKMLILRPFALMQDMEIPVMPAVETIKMTDFPRNHVVPESDFGTLRIFPAGLKVSLTFPSLKSLRYEFPDMSKGLLDRYFPVDVYVVGQLSEDGYFEEQTVALNGTVEQYSSIEEVTIAGNHPKAWPITTLQFKFPNLKSLKIDFGMKCLNKAVPPSVLWSTRSPVECLELYNVRYCDYLRSSHQSPLDSFFTGIPDWLCTKLHMCTEKDVEYPDVRLIRKGTSICNLKMLKILRICFVHDLPPSSARIFRLEADESPLISNISQVYAFDLMPELRVVISHDHTHPNSSYLFELLQPMNSYARFVHRKQHAYTFA